VKLAIGVGVGKRVAEKILAAEFVSDIEEGLREIVDAIRKENAASGFVGVFLEDFFALRQVKFFRSGSVGSDPVVVGANGVNGHAGAVGHLDGVAQGVVAQIVITVADEDENAADIRIRTRGGWRGHQLLAGSVNGVVERRAAAGILLLDYGAQLADVVGIVLNDFGLVVERHYERLILVAADYGVKKIHCGIFFEVQALADTV